MFLADDCFVVCSSVLVDQDLTEADLYLCILHCIKKGRISCSRLAWYDLERDMSAGS